MDHFKYKIYQLIEKYQKHIKTVLEYERERTNVDVDRSVNVGVYDEVVKDLLRIVGDSEDQR